MSELQAGRVQRYPRGYLGALGAQTSGTTPADLASFVQPMFEMRPWLLFGAIAVASTGISLVAGTGPNAIAGPGSAAPWLQDSLWAVHGITVRSNAVLPAGHTLRACAALTLNNGTNQMAFGDPVTFTTGEQATWGWRFEEPLLISRQDSVGIFINSYVGAGPIACAGYVRYTMLESQ